MGHPPPQILGDQPLKSPTIARQQKAGTKIAIQS